MDLKLLWCISVCLLVSYTPSTLAGPQEDGGGSVRPVDSTVQELLDEAFEEQVREEGLTYRTQKNLEERVCVCVTGLLSTAALSGVRNQRLADV